MNTLFYIKDNIYLSNLINAHNIENLKNNNIKIVIRLSEDNNISPYEKSYNYIKNIKSDIRPKIVLVMN